jgi:hypothetical protein
MDKERAKELAREFNLAYWDEEVSNVEWAIMDKLSEIMAFLKARASA